MGCVSQALFGTVWDKFLRRRRMFVIQSAQFVLQPEANQGPAAGKKPKADARKSLDVNHLPFCPQRVWTVGHLDTWTVGQLDTGTL